MKRVPDAALVAAIGVVAFASTVGFAALNPGNLGWLAFGDSPTQQLGWEFFRQQHWTWPLGIIPSYGMELGGSLVYSDSIPLIAIPLKVLHPLLPETFQYFGCWLLLCFLLQSLFAWRVFALFTNSRSLRVCGTIFLVTAPVLLWRMSPAVSQWSLSGQFTILIAFWLTVRPGVGKHWRNWTLLLAVTTAIHAYLLLMVALLWAADLVQRRHQFASIRQRQLTLLLPPMGVALVAWTSGYFTISRGAGGAGYGIFKASPLAFFDPGNPAAGLWSRVIPDLRGDWIHNESFNFVGIGILLLLAVAFVRKSSVKELRTAAVRWPWTTAAITALTLFALTNDIGGHYYFLHLPMPHGFENIASVFRASGRMLWPATYAVSTAAIVLVARSYRTGIAALLTALCLVAQITDSSSAWREIGRAFEVSAELPYVQPLSGEFWGEAASRYRDVRALPLEIHPPGWARIAKFASEHGLQTDVVYLARVNAPAVELRRAQLTRFIATGCYPRESLFLVQPKMADQVRRSLNASRDLLTEQDGLLILAPGWFSSEVCHASR